MCITHECLHRAQCTLHLPCTHSSRADTCTLPRAGGITKACAFKEKLQLYHEDTPLGIIKHVDVLVNSLDGCDPRLFAKQLVPDGVHPMHMLSDDQRDTIWLVQFMCNLYARLEDDSEASLADEILECDLPGGLSIDTCLCV